MVRRFWPRSLLGQVLVSAALALLVAQAISAALALRAGAQLREEALLNSAAFRFIAGYERVQGDRPPGARRGGRRERRARLEAVGRLPPLFLNGQDDERAQRLKTILVDQGVPVSAIRVTSSTRRIGFSRDDRADGGSRARRGLGIPAPDRWFYVAVRYPQSAGWVVTRLPEYRRSPGALSAILLQTAIIYLLLVGGLALLLRRATRPLAQLTHRVEQFGRAAPGQPPLQPAGPEDVRRLIAAHNAMEQRIAALLDEKDVMLGAIGHDLKTPLAALRVRIESVESSAQRARMVEGIEDITRSLDDILSLARIGRAGSPPEAVRLDALVDSVVEEFEDMGRPVSLEATERITARVHETWLRRALRNLIENALRYGDVARVSLLREGESIVLRVDDEGPGIPPDRIAAMLEPFQRGEASRNRATGGAGLGLTLARAIAEDHGGSLVLSNRAGGGLRAEIRLAIEGVRA
ncbi:two-component sensor histidine kinase [Erythrobacter sp. 3-20A1M]|uniref:sensor histidine kinase n=1 Tax=Erythrobacter sp. 3-20A1M TaxID=2653850 RepID=UPI001BFC9056|nr:ATP-binding protein [Erythrobacter sp. 3-20A1M]QWC56657.1 two-component sensor histidine kinase [Erythrobacter sp. 3-20A1M]